MSDLIKAPRFNSNDGLFVFLLHLISSEFGEHAVLKGGMVLRLLGSKRKTIDLDYVFVPYSSKKEILGQVKELFSRIEGVTYEISINSKTIRVNISSGEYRAQVEISVEKKVRNEVISSSGLHGSGDVHTSRVIRIMSLDIALAHKIAAWNERRLARDAYDIHYFFSVHGVRSDLNVLKERLLQVESRRPELKKRKKMSLKQLIKELEEYMASATEKSISAELQALVEEDELAGLAKRMQNSISRLIRELDKVIED